MKKSVRVFTPLDLENFLKEQEGKWWTPSEIGKELGVDLRTVKSKIRKLRNMTHKGWRLEIAERVRLYCVRMVSENDLLEGLWLRIEKDGNVVSNQRLNEKTFDRLKRLLELIAYDEDALHILDKVIDAMEAPKREITKIISNRLLALDKMPGMLQDALMILPLVQLKDMESSLDELELRREPSGARAS